jgi:hypothetical protein
MRTHRHREEDSTRSDAEASCYTKNDENSEQSTDYMMLRKTKRKICFTASWEIPQRSQLFRLVTARQRIADVSFALQFRTGGDLHTTQPIRTALNPNLPCEIRDDRDVTGVLLRCRLLGHLRPTSRAWLAAGTANVKHNVHLEPWSRPDRAEYPAIRIHIACAAAID